MASMNVEGGGMVSCRGVDDVHKSTIDHHPCTIIIVTIIIITIVISSSMIKHEQQQQQHHVTMILATNPTTPCQAQHPMHAPLLQLCSSMLPYGSSVCVTLSCHALAPDPMERVEGDDVHTHTYTIHIYIQTYARTRAHVHTHTASWLQRRHEMGSPYYHL